MKHLKKIVIAIFILAVGINLSFVLISRDPYLVARRRSLSLNVGQRYFGRLSLWYLYAQKGDWPSALKLETKLDPPDILNYQKTHYPPELKKTINSLVFKSNKTADDWMELARIQLILDNLSAASDSVSRARQLDPIRDDISAVYYQLVR